MSFTPRPLYHRYTFNWRMGGPQSLAGSSEKRAIRISSTDRKLRTVDNIAKSGYRLKHPLPYTIAILSPIRSTEEQRTVKVKVKFAL